MQGLHLSPVQATAVEITLIADERLKAKDFFERFKMAVVSADPQMWLPRMFPEWVKAPEESTVVEDTEDLDLSDTEGEWIFEDQNVTAEEAERVFAQALAEGGGNLTLDDVPEDEGWQ